MRLSSVGEVNPVVTGAILDATLPKTALARDTVKLDDGPNVGGLLLLGVGVFILWAIQSAAPPPKGGTINGY